MSDAKMYRLWAKKRVSFMDIVLIKRDVVSGLEIEISGKYSFPFI
jgi:hypothetical protein